MTTGATKRSTSVRRSWRKLWRIRRAMAAVRSRLTDRASERARKASSSRVTPASRAQLGGGALGEQASEAQQASRRQRSASSITWLETTMVTPSPGHLARSAARARPQLRVDADGGLVEEEQAGPVDQSAGEGDPLPHPPAQGRHHRAPARGEVDQLQRLGDLGPRARPRLETVDGGEEADVLLHAEVGVEGGRLGHVPDLGQDARSGMRRPSTSTRPGLGGDQPDQRADEGRFARAVRAPAGRRSARCGRSARRRPGLASGRRT